MATVSSRLRSRRAFRATLRRCARPPSWYVTMGPTIVELVAYLTVAEDRSVPAGLELRQFLRNSAVLEPMDPVGIRVGCWSALPLTPNGKVDLRVPCLHPRELLTRPVARVRGRHPRTGRGGGGVGLGRRSWASIVRSAPMTASSTLAATHSWRPRSSRVSATTSASRSHSARAICEDSSHGRFDWPSVDRGDPVVAEAAPGAEGSPIEPSHTSPALCRSPSRRRPCGSLISSRPASRPSMSPPPCGSTDRSTTARWNEASTS